TLLFAGSVTAQMPGRPMGAQGMNIGKFFGKVIDGNTNKPMEAASVQLTKVVKDTTTDENKELVIAAQLTDKKGEFLIDNLPVRGNYQILISGIGFAPYFETISFLPNAADRDLGNIKMVPDPKQLE